MLSCLILYAKIATCYLTYPTSMIGGKRFSRGSIIWRIINPGLMTRLFVLLAGLFPLIFKNIKFYDLILFAHYMYSPPLYMCIRIIENKKGETFFPPFLFLAGVPTQFV